MTPEGVKQLVSKTGQPIEEGVLSLLEAQIRTLGDFVGHPFRGNQYTDGFGDDFYSSPEGAANELADGRIANVEAGHVRDVVMAAAELGGTVDLTNLVVDGEPLFREGLGLRRDEMPQIPGANTPAFFDELKADGVTMEREDVDPRSLRPVQDEISAVKTGEQLRYYEESGRTMRPIIASKDDYVLDGHHRWAVQVVLATDAPRAGIRMPIMRLGIDHREALGRMRDFNRRHGVETRELGGKGSGNFGHAGRPGQVGGSTKEGASVGIIPFNQLGKAGEAGWFRRFMYDPKKDRFIFSQPVLDKHGSGEEGVEGGAHAIDHGQIKNASPFDAHVRGWAYPPEVDEELDIDLPHGLIDLFAYGENLPGGKDDPRAAAFDAIYGAVKGLVYGGATRDTELSYEINGKLTTGTVGSLFPELFRTLARKETPLYAIADQHAAKLTTAIWHAFVVARKAMRKADDAARAKALGVVTLRAELKEFFAARLRAMVVAGGEHAAGGLRIADTFRAAKQDPKPKLSFTFDAKRQAVIDWADKHAAELINNISETSREAINNAVAEYLETGDWEEYKDEILAAVGDERRAKLIARNESMIAVHHGQREAWDQAVEAGLLTGNERRQWLVVGDEKVCPICDGLDGKIADLDGVYRSHGEEYEGPPAHVSCRCSEGLTGSRALGGKGSGNFGHAGRPGQVGGSSPAGEPEPFSVHFEGNVDAVLGERGTEVFSHLPGNLKMKAWPEYGNVRAHLSAKDYKFEFELNRKSGELVAQLENMRVDSSAQGKGIAKDVLRETFDAFEKSGVKSAFLYASLETGGYAWAKFGFKADKPAWMAAELTEMIDDGEVEFDDGQAEALRSIIRQYHNDPRLPWAVAGLTDGDRKIGKELLLAHSPEGWTGRFDFDDKEAMGRFRKYVGR